MTWRTALGARALILTILLLSLALVVACGQSAPATTAPGAPSGATTGPGADQKTDSAAQTGRSGTYAHPVYRSREAGSHAHLGGGRHGNTDANSAAPCRGYLRRSNPHAYLLRTRNIPAVARSHL